MRLRFLCFLLVVLFLPVSLFAQTVAPSTMEGAQALSVEPVRVYHDHSIRDIDAIGNRNVGCGRGIGNWYSLERQIAMGRDYSSQVESTSKILSDPEVTAYINRIGQNLVRNSDSQVPFTIKVLDSDDVNAFALPGGFFYVDTGLIDAAQDEAELAGVMAHEIAHVAACHAARGRTRGQLMHLATLPMMMIGGPLGYVAYQSMTVAMPLTFMKFSRKFESEADYLAIQYMYKAGYDPQALTSFFERVKALEKHKQSAVARAFESHPQTKDRILQTQEEIDTLLPPEAEYTVDTSDFEAIKDRLNRLENHHRGDDSGRPALKRRPAGTSAGDTEAPTAEQPISFSGGALGVPGKAEP
jgi:predicted Zn-dependent protease